MIVYESGFRFVVYTMPEQVMLYAQCFMRGMLEEKAEEQDERQTPETA
ncbi:hypothetical protein ACLHDD_18125 [Pantoea sp. NSTU24]